MSKQQIEPLVNYFPAAEFLIASPKHEACINVGRLKIAFSGALVDAIPLKPGNKVLLAQDNIDTSIWYMVIHESGFRLKAGSTKKAKYLLLHCRSLSEMILASWDDETKGKASNIIFDCDVKNPFQFPKQEGLLPNIHFKLTMKSVTYEEPELTPSTGHAG